MIVHVWDIYTIDAQTGEQAILCSGLEHFALCEVVKVLTAYGSKGPTSLVIRCRQEVIHE